MLGWRLKEYKLLMVLLLTSTTWGGVCHIEILNEKNSGEKIRLKFQSKLKSQKQCQELARMHRPNFNPDQIKLKQVNYRWTGSSQAVSKRNRSSKRHRSSKF